MIIIFSFRANFGDIWLGITDLATEGKWIGVQTNKEITYHHWREGEPNGGTRENCVNMWAGIGGRWNDNVCDGKLHYVCKKEQSKLNSSKDGS